MFTYPKYRNVIEAKTHPTAREISYGTQLYTRVTLTCDIPERNLKRGDVAMLIDTVPDPDTGEDDYILEIFNAIGETLDVAIVPPTALVPLRAANEVLSVRVLAEA